MFVWKGVPRKVNRGEKILSFFQTHQEVKKLQSYIPAATSHSPFCHHAFLVMMGGTLELESE